MRQEVKNENGSVANQAPLSKKVNRRVAELPPVPLKLATKIYEAIEANGGEEVCLSARELAEHTGLGERTVEKYRRLLADQGVLRMRMEARRWWYGLPDEIRDATPLPTEKAGATPVPELAPAGRAGAPVSAAEGPKSAPASGAGSPAAAAETPVAASHATSQTTPDPAHGAGSRVSAPAGRFNETSSTPAAAQSGDSAAPPAETSAEAPAPASAPAEPAPAAPAQAGPPPASVEPPAPPPPTLEQRLGAAMQQRVPYHKITLADIRRAQECVPNSELAFASREWMAQQQRSHENIEVFLADLWNQCTEGYYPRVPSVFRQEWDRRQRALKTAPKT